MGEVYRALIGKYNSKGGKNVEKAYDAPVGTSRGRVSDHEKRGSTKSWSTKRVNVATGVGVTQADSAFDYSQGVGKEGMKSESVQEHSKIGENKVEN